MKEVNLKKGNCLIYSICFKVINPSAKILIRWNKKRKIPSFIPKLNNELYIYKPITKDKRFKLIFKGKVVVLKTN